jgi:hypothetical protein
MPPSAQRRLPLAVRLASAPLVVVALVAGVWVAGGLITNDFRAAMSLTIAWMAIAGAACLAVAIVRRDLRVPVIAAYLLTAAALGIYLGRSELFDDRVDERVAVAPPPTAVRHHGRPAARVNVRLARGTFEPVAHPARGVATAIRLTSGRRVLTLTDFRVSNGPDLRVYLVRGPARDESEVKSFADLGGLKGNIGDQQYDIPAKADLRGRTVVVWCRAFSVDFARAELE